MKTKKVDLLSRIKGYCAQDAERLEVFFGSANPQIILEYLLFLREAKVVTGIHISNPVIELAIRTIEAIAYQYDCQEADKKLKNIPSLVLFREYEKKFHTTFKTMREVILFMGATQSIKNALSHLPKEETSPKKYGKSRKKHKK